jgi:putative phage-type endonuclease
MTEDARTEWLRERSAELVVGSSDAAAILGLSPWDSAHTLALRKLGQLEPIPDSPLLELGRLVEPALAELYHRQTGRQPVEPVPKLRRHPSLPWQVASPDYLLPPDGILELKLVSPYDRGSWGEPGTDAIPDHYLIQVQHQIAVLGAQWADVAPLVWGRELAIYRVERHDPLIARITEAEAEWIDLVRAGKTPEPDWGHRQTLAALQAIHGVDTTCQIDLPAEYEPLIESWHQLTAQERECSRQREEIKARLLHAMGDAAIARLPSGATVCRAERTRRGYTVQPTTYIEFRITMPKGGQDK